MTGWLGSRLIQSLIVLVVMSAVIHGLMGLMPGDPIDLMIASDPHLNAADAIRLKALYGLDRPWGERYLAWIAQVLRGELGYSRLFAKPVLAIIGPALLNSLILMLSALALSLLIAVPLGIVAALRPGRALDHLINAVSFASVSLPTFWLGLMLMVVFAVLLGWLPAGGMQSLSGEASGLADSLRHMALPVATLTIAGIGQYARHTRAAMLAEAGQDYIRTAKAKGCGPARLVLRHQWRNALLPLITLLGLEFGTLFSGALITETVFGWPGMGKLIADAVMGNDFNLALTALMLATAMTLLGSVLADLLMARLDPRIKLR
ncbi:ABC transporter permease [Magnetospirillum sulfuroxidans]|uniref:ABC transporter permease n=1 Tax=Magnetospirillum sulfuroxidans TaxID=611300 RepID=A0ABS5IBU9_9PROT|nr:ABC transporter permease [Magnetospirillum sulfuroxidans]MBR9971902.1 ABC transporter permease [Magnetospirillum sulfuroxidans]